MVLNRAGSPAPSGEPDGTPDDSHDVGPAAPAPAGGAQSDATVQMEGANAVDNAMETVQPSGPAGAEPAAEPRPAEPQPVQQVLDPRAIARASLGAGRNASLWWTSAGVIVSMIIALAVGTRAGAYTLAAVLAACAVVRAVLPHPGPIAISVRAKAIDLAVLGLLAVSIAVLAGLLPGRAS